MTKQYIKIKDEEIPVNIKNYKTNIVIIKAKYT